jgi:hypothetical protein
MDGDTHEEFAPVAAQWVSLGANTHSGAVEIRRAPAPE